MAEQQLVIGDSLLLHWDAMTRTITVTLCLLALAVLVRADDAWDKHVDEYHATQKRPSLWKRTQGREALAMTLDPRAIPLLAKDYKSAEKPRDQVQYLCASIATRYCTGKEFVDAFEAWRLANTRPEDAWLWFRTLQIYANDRGVADVVAIVKDAALNVFLRAAALEAIAKRTDAAMPALITHLLNNQPEDTKKWVLIESCMSALVAQGPLSAEMRPPAQRLAEMLDFDYVPEHTRLVIARSFRRLFEAERAYLTSAPWLKLIAGDKQRVPSRTLAQPTFLGLQAEGERICYVIDLSDSMLTPLTSAEKDALRNPVTGPDKPKPPEDPDIAALPWDKINTRFDAAREFLKLSLKRLSTNQHFAVIWFGTGAGLLEETPGLQKVTDKRIEKVIAELDAITPGKPTEARALGTLRGLTNMHGGLHRAFKAKSSGLVKDYEYVDWVTFTQGADTIFLLSDGKQSWSDWDALDKTDSKDAAGDPETGQNLPGGGEYAELHFYGPYVDQRHMLEDIIRLNLFRKAEIHCIGIGEADPETLKAISSIGHGQLRIVGK